VNISQHHTVNTYASITLFSAQNFDSSVLGSIETSLKEILIDVANRYEYEIIQMEVMPDHIHIFVGATPTVAPMDIVRIFKSITTIELFKKYPKLKYFYSRCGSLWSAGKFISTIGNVSAETIKKYIADQKGK